MEITLDPELETALRDVAHRQGVSPEVLAVEAIRDRYLESIPSADLGADEWVRKLRQVATNCGVALSDADVSSEGIYE